MIWYLCKKCGKTHGRSDNSAGTLVFCECGQGNTVPWESTASEPVATPVVELPKVPDLGPIQFDPVSAPATPAASASTSPNPYPARKPPPPIEDEDRPYRRGRTERRDPDLCFNHQRRPKVQACTDCDEGFCADCLVNFQGVLLCGPCKNFRVRRQELPASTSTLASTSLLISLIAGPIMMCLLLATPNSSSMHVLSWLSLLPQVVSIGLGLWSLRESERESKPGGQWVAATGVIVASMTCVLMVLLHAYTLRLV